MSIWTLDIAAETGARSIIGTAPDAATGRAAALRAIRAHAAAAGFIHPTYTAAVDGELIAIIGTGVDDAGLPDHRGLVELLGGLTDAPNPFPGC